MKIFCGIIWILLLFDSLAVGQSNTDLYQPQKDSVRVSKQPYQRYFTNDKFERKITFYLSEENNETKALPLIVYVQGSGCGSLFRQQNERIFPNYGHITVQEVAKGKARVLIVEKPGVSFLDQPQNCQNANEFNREHTLERWSEAVAASILAAQKLSDISSEKTLIVGHSVGGLVACRVAKNLLQTVTHITLIAGGGGSQLFDLLTLTRKGNFFREVSENPEERVKYLLNQWKMISEDPINSEKFFFGFAYRRWSTFLASSPLEELEKINAKIYIVQGTADEAVNPTSADVLFAQLSAKNKDLNYQRIEGADHSLNIKGNSQINGWQMEFEKLVEWFLVNQQSK